MIHEEHPTFVLGCYRCTLGYWGLIDRLYQGCVYRKKRWSGDVHSDLGGSIDEEATDAVMEKAAKLLEWSYKMYYEKFGIPDWKDG